jgi:hypothetical protein
LVLGRAPEWARINLGRFHEMKTPDPAISPRSSCVDLIHLRRRKQAENLAIMPKAHPRGSVSERGVGPDRAVNPVEIAGLAAGSTPSCGIRTGARIGSNARSRFKCFVEYDDGIVHIA